MTTRVLMRPAAPRSAARVLLWMAMVLVLAAGPAWQAGGAQPVDKAADDYNMASWLYASKKYDMAAEEFRSFLKNYPKHEKTDEACLTLARALLHLEKYDDAAQVLDGLRKDSPKYDRMPEVLFELGRAWAAMGKQKEAAAVLGEVIDNYGNHYLATWARDQRGSLLIALNDYDAAEKTLMPLVGWFLTGKDADKHLKAERERLAKVSPSVAAALDGLLERSHLNLGLARFAAGKFTPARGTFEEFLALAPKSAMADTARFNLAQSLYKLGDFARASQVYSAVAKTSGPYAADAAFEGGLALYQAKKYKEAAAALADCAKRFPKADRADKALLYAGTCAYLAEDYSGAARHLADKVKATPKDAEALYWLGMAQLKRGKAGDARDAFERAAKAEPDGPRAADAAIGRADALLAEGKNEEAAKAYQEFAGKFADNPDRPRALYAAAAALNRAAKYDDSDAACGAFLGDEKARQSDLAPQVLFISGENRFLLKKYKEAADRYGELLKRYPKADDVPAARFRLAWIRYFDKQYDGAIREISEALKAKDPPFKADAQYLLGNCQFEKGDYPAALASLDQYLADSGAKRYRDDAMLKSALALERQGNRPDATGRLEQFLKDYGASPLRPRAEYELAELLRADKNFDAAADHYKTVAERYEGHDLAPYALYGLGTCRFEKGDFEGAAAAFGRISEKYSGSDLAPQAQYQQGLALQKAGKFGEARAAFEAMTKANPKHDLAPAAYLGLGVCLEKEKRFADAAQAFRSLIGTGGDKKLREQAMYELAWSLQEAGKDAEALQAYEALAKEFPTSSLAADAYFKSAEARYAEKKYPEATDLYEKAFGAAQDDRLKDKILYRLGWCKWAAGGYEESAKLFDRLVAECPASDLVPEGLFQAGEALLKLGKPADAIARLEKLMDPKYKDFEHLADARFRVGEAQLVLGRQEQAVATLTALEQAHPQYPAMPEVQFNIGRALYNLKQYDQSRARFERVTGMTDTETAAKAQFYLGETFLAEGNGREALKAYLRVVALWGNYKEWAAAAQFEIGKAYQQLDKPAEAREAFQTVVSKYGDTKWAQPAKDQLEKTSG